MRKNILILFGILDIVSIILHYKLLLTPFYTPPVQWFSLKSFLIPSLLVISFIFTAYGFIFGKQWAFWVSYIQVPLRFLFAIFSFGILFYINRLVFHGSYYQEVFFLCSALEVLKTIYVIICHRS